MKKSIILLLLMTFFVTNCSKDGGNEEPKLLELPDVSVIDVGQDSDFDLWVLGKEDYFFIKANASLTYPEEVLYHSSELNKEFSIFFNSQTRSNHHTLNTGRLGSGGLPLAGPGE